MPEEDDTILDDDDREGIETGRVVVQVGIGPDGEPRVQFALDGLSSAEALGLLTMASDLIRLQEAQNWGLLG